MAGGMLFSESKLIAVKLFVFIHKFYNIFRYNLINILEKMVKLVCNCSLVVHRYFYKWEESLLTSFPQGIILVK